MIGTPATLRLYNKRAIVRTLQHHAPASRAELAKAVGLSQVTAGKIVELTGLDRKLVDKAMAELKKTGQIESPKRCYWSPSA